MKIANLVFNTFINDSRVLKESISLGKAGHTVEVIAHSSRELKEFEEHKFYKIRRFSYLDRSKKRSILSKLGAYIKYLKESIKHVKEFDLLHCNDLDTLPVAFVVKQFYNKKIKVVYDAHEHETERWHQSSFDKKVLKYVESFFLKYVDEVITVSQPIANDYVKLYNIKKPTLIFNTPQKIEITKKDIFRERFNIPKEHVIFLYQGGLQPRRGILEFYELIKDKEQTSYIIMGFGELKERILELTKTSKNLYFLDAVSPDVLLDYTSSADIGVCIEENLCKSWDYALPNKLFEYSMVGLPVIVSGLSELKRFVNENKNGYVIEDIFDQNEFDKLFPKIIKTYKDKTPYIKNIRDEYNWQNQEKRLLELYQKLTTQKLLKKATV